MKPSVGRVVHYVSHGTPIRPDGTQAYTAQCRAAIVTEVAMIPGTEDVIDSEPIGLCVLNPTGMFFRTMAEGGCHHDEQQGAGTWHWPERVE